MKELQEIISKSKDYSTRNLCLATVVKTRGSSYRKSGARMLIANGEQICGLVSGGCLEADVIAHSEIATARGSQILLTYDTSPDGDRILGTGLGCDGTIDILVEPICYGSACLQHLRFAEKILRHRTKGVAATIIRQNGVPGCKVADRLLLDENGRLYGEISDGALKELVVAAMVRSFEEGESSTELFRTASGSAEVFLEVIVPPTRLIVFGAGYDAIPVARIAGEIGFMTTLADHRPGYANHDRFPEVKTILVGRPETIDLTDHVDRMTTAIIMTHNYSIDQWWLKRLLPAGLRYLGLMGPRKRAEKMIQELREEGLEFTENCFATFHNPVGLDIGAESPEQIALGILGEIQATLSGHAGGSLRNKRGAIHAPDNLALQSAMATGERGQISCLASA